MGYLFISTSGLCIAVLDGLRVGPELIVAKVIYVLDLTTCLSSIL
jgi:hypothetical protein